MGDIFRGILQSSRISSLTPCQCNPLELLLSDSLDADGENNPLSLIDVVRVDDNMLEDGPAGCMRKGTPLCGNPASMYPTSKKPWKSCSSNTKKSEQNAPACLQAGAPHIP